MRVLAKQLALPRVARQVSTSLCLHAPANVTVTPQCTWQCIEDDSLAKLHPALQQRSQCMQDETALLTNLIHNMHASLRRAYAALNGSYGASSASLSLNGGSSGHVSTSADNKGDVYNDQEGHVSVYNVRGSRQRFSSSSGGSSIVGQAWVARSCYSGASSKICSSSVHGSTPASSKAGKCKTFAAQAAPSHLESGLRQRGLQPARMLHDVRSMIFLTWQTLVYYTV